MDLENSFKVCYLLTDYLSDRKVHYKATQDGKFCQKDAPPKQYFQ